MAPNPYSKSIAAGTPVSAKKESKKSSLKSSTSSNSTTSKKTTSISIPENSVLKAEIKSLGGDDEDYAMLAGIDSDDQSEIEGEPSSSSKKGSKSKTGEPVDVS